MINQSVWLGSLEPVMWQPQCLASRFSTTPTQSSSGALAIQRQVPVRLSTLPFLKKIATQDKHYPEPDGTWSQITGRFFSGEAGRPVVFGDCSCRPLCWLGVGYAHFACVWCSCVPLSLPQPQAPHQGGWVGQSTRAPCEITRQAADFDLSSWCSAAGVL